MTTTQVEQTNTELIRRGFTAFAAGDMATLAELFEANATWHAAPVGILSGSYNDRDAIFSSFAQLQKETAGTFRSNPVAMAASGDKVFVQAVVSGERKGRKLQDDEILVFTIANNRVREVHLYPGNYPASAAFWA
jgi:ketosteroid isomerase-like protein